jgi:hypothetical protein
VYYSTKGKVLKVDTLVSTQDCFHLPFVEKGEKKGDDKEYVLGEGSIKRQ